jgi:hypothetical protein
VSTAVEWIVFAELSTDATIAAGNAVKGSTARWMVETILANVPNAGWGEIVRVAAGQLAAEPDLGEWPPAGQVYLCRRAARNGYKWVPLFPV